LVLPHGADEIQFEWLTGTVQVTDELIPDDENEDVQYEERGKSNLVVIIRIDGGDDASNTIPRKSKKVSTKRDVNRPSGKRLADSVAPVKPPQPAKPIVVFQEPDQDDDMGE
jgi:ribonuclease P/MRP protein subunit RPP20